MATATISKAETAHRNNQVGAVEAAEILVGNIIRNIAAAPRMVIEVLQTSLAVPHGGTRYQIARRVPDNRLADRAEIWPAVAAEELA